MKTAFATLVIRSSATALLVATVCFGFPPAARAGLSLEMNLIRNDVNGYYFSPNLMTNDTPANIPFGDYQLASPQSPTNGIFPFHYHFDTNGFNQTAGYSWGYSDFDSVRQQLTNGVWSLFVTNSIETNVYYFNVTANIDSNALPIVAITFPANGAVNVTNQPEYTWEGPTNYSGLVVYAYNYSSDLPVTQTNLPSPSVLYQGINNFTVHYDSNSVTAVVSSTPLDASSHPISSWVSTAHLQDYISSQFTVGVPDTSGTAHTLVADYPFDATSGPVLDAAVDTSGNGYDMSFGDSFGSQGGINLTSDAEAGVGAVQFIDGNGNSAGYLGWSEPTPPALLSTLAGSFTISCWIKTIQNNFGWDTAPAYYGAGIVSADNAGLANDVIPIALTGNKIGFNTGGDTEDVTLNSSASVNDGNYHHIVVTRNQQTGQKIIYIDGVFDSFSSGTTNLLSDPQKLTIGALANAGNPDPNDGSYYNGFDGEVDDLQIYSGVLSAGDVANLHANPGTTAANGGGFSGGHKNVAHYTFDDSGNLGHDSSGNGNDMNFETYWGQQHQFATDAEAGGGAVQFFGTDDINANYDAPVLANLNAVLAGSFTFSAWVKTTVTNGEDYNNAFFGGVIFWAYNDHGNTNDTIPLSITGSKAAFTTEDHLGNDNTLHSLTSVNDGNYHLITVTRDQSSGEKKIYVDGQFEASEIGTTDPLNGNNYNLTIGGYAYILNTTSTVTNYSSYSGLLDDVQIYSGVLSATEVASLFTNPGTTVPDVTGGSGGPVAHYDFDEGTALAADVSGNNNNIVYAGNFGGSGPTIDTDHIGTSGGSVYFDGGSFLSAPEDLCSTLAGSFSISLWVKTTQDNGDPNDVAWTGDAIIAADIPYAGANDLIPVALTGGQIAFNTANTQYNYDDTINSSATVNDGNWHHVVVSRNQPTGEKSIYIDGVLDVSDIDATNLLNDPRLITLGCKADASNPDPTSPSHTGANGFNGLVDDIQIYPQVLDPNEVAFLHDNPGAVLSGGDNISAEFNAALNTTNLNWSTSGDTSWFVESTNTYNGAPSAAQSGVVVNNQTSTLSMTVTGPGELTFSWACMADDAAFDYEVYRDGDPNNNYFDDLDYNTSGWYPDGPFYVPPGTHTISWTAFANGDTDPTEAGFLDQVSFVPDTAPMITLNPFDQTNYPGYPVWLNAGATNNTSATWQWYEVGSGAISNAINSYFIPTNSGTAGVVGSYYAVASTDVGSAITTTASVSFVSAPLPPDWSRAFKSPFQAQDPEQVTKDYYYGAILDVSNNIYSAAEFGGNMTVGSVNASSGPGGDAAAIVKQSSTGSPLWFAAITNNGNASAYGEDVAPAPGGGVYLAGDFSGNNWLGTNKLVDAGGGDMFLARFDAGGSNIWIKAIGGTNADFMLINSLASDSSGNVTLCGLLGAGPVTIGASNYMVSGQEGVIAQFDQNGVANWSQILPGGWPQYICYGAGRLYVSVNSTSGGTTNVVIGGVSNLTDRAWAVACLNETNGQAIWVRGVGAPSGGGNGNPYATGVIDDVPRLAVSGTNVFLTGVAYGSSASFGPLTVNFDLPRGQYFARYDTNGNPQAATSYGSVTTTPIAAVANASGDVYVSGDFNTYSFFGNDMIAAPAYPKLSVGGLSQAFLAKFDANGNPLWVREAVSPSLVNFLGIALANDGVWASGWCLSTNTVALQPTAFGTNNVFSDPLFLTGGEGSGVTIIWYPAGVLAKITDSATTASRVTLLNPQDDGTNFHFQFLSQSGFNHSILYRTNLIIGIWQTNSTVTGDGTLKNISVPLSIFGSSGQGFIRVSTQ